MNDERRPARNAAASPLSASLDGSNRHGQQLERLLTAREVGEILGFASATVQDWSQRGEIPGFRVGGRLRFRQSEVAAWIETQRKTL